MNEYLKNLNRLEFVVTMACTGRCKHCSEGDHSGNSEHIDGDVAAKAIKEICQNYNIQSLMTFGGVTGVMVSADAFHQETIPLEPVRFFANCVKNEEINVHVHPAWLASKEDDNPYNVKTREILQSFTQDFLIFNATAPS